jgi:Golgi phosphoprotein 3 GPP34
MKPPETLPGELFLLAYDTRKKRLTNRSQLGYILRAGALNELYLRGHLVDADGKAQAAKKSTGLDSVLTGVLEQVSASSPKKWQHWVRKDPRAMFHAVRDQLAADRVIKVEPYRVLGIFPATRVTLRQPQVASRLASKVGSIARGRQPLSRVGAHDTALTALITASDIKVTVSGKDRRENKKTITQLTAAAGPVAPALRRVIKEANAAASG